MAGDLSAWRCLGLEVEVSCEVVDRGLVVENLPLSSPRGVWSKEELTEGFEVEEGQGDGLASVAGRAVGCWVWLPSASFNKVP